MEARKHGDDEPAEGQPTLEAATERARALCRTLQEKTTAAAKATDGAVHEHPYQAIGIAFGLGVLVGVLVGWRRRGGE